MESFITPACALLCMIQSFTPDLSRQDIYANGNEICQVIGKDRDEAGNLVTSVDEQKRLFVASFRNPVLVTDNARILSFNDPTARDTIAALFASPVRYTEYDGISFRFEQAKHPGVWGPSIDTLLFSKALRALDLDRAKNVVEWGGGSGFISLFNLHKRPGLELLHVFDLNDNAVKCCQDVFVNAWAQKLKEGGSFPETVIEKRDGIVALTGSRRTLYDLILCNPPYIPRRGKNATNAYEGLSLLAALIEHGHNHLNPVGRIFTNVSSLCDRIIYPLAHSVGAELVTLEEKTVPLKIMNVLNNPEWMDYLRSQGLQKHPHRGYDYWHTIKIVEVRR
jgi:methylase of polypeptide subunit release factors